MQVKGTLLTRTNKLRSKMCDPLVRTIKKQSSQRRVTMKMPTADEQSNDGGTNVSGYTSAGTTVGGTRSSKQASLIELREIDKMIPVAIKAVVSVWLTLLLLVHCLVDSKDLVYLEGGEREACLMACAIFAVSISVTLVPVYAQKLGFVGSGLVDPNNPKKMSSILCALVMVQSIAGFTNFLMAFFPTVVVVDPYTHARVYFVRWCEWIPLSGFMTFLSEIVDCNHSMYGVLIPVLVALSQSLSCVCALVLPYSPNLKTWLVVMFISCILWAMMFPRLYQKYQLYIKSRNGISLPDMERSCRIEFAFNLFGVCTTCWSFLVALYFINMAAFHMYPNSSWVQTQSLAMVMDTIFDVTAKAFYMRLIVHVHEAVFDADGRARRELSDLKRMVSVLWEGSSDVIVISVGGGPSISTMISPTFPALVGVELVDQNPALMVTSRVLPQKNVSLNGEGSPIQLESTSKFVKSSELPYYAAKRQRQRQTVDAESQELLTRQAGSLVQAAWNGMMQRKMAGGELDEDDLEVLDLHKMDGSLIKCEIKLSSHANNAVIAVVRNVTERYLRFEAERRAHDEYQARQKEALTVNRFTRHEIKNGLLAGIELCQEASKLTAAMAAPSRGNLSRQNSLGSATRLGESGEEHSAINCIAQLDQTLHEVLDTVLAEAMAREIVHESYKPKLERVLLKNVLGGGSKLKDAEQRQRFPLHICPKDTPALSMDPQLLKYIHRNAVSNAVKYGKQGGRVTTEVHYFEKKGEFELDVINEPGPWNEVLIAMGEEATNNVFAQGKRLKVHDNPNDDETDNNISSGDGAWIMQRCARTMGGGCTIRFDPHQTVFSFRCKVDPYTLPWAANEDFQVPAGTYGIAYDDSNIQRKLMKRIFSYAGVEEDRIIVKGKSATDIKKFDKLLKDILSKSKDSNILVLMDENLDYEQHGQSKRMSGSKHAQIAYQKLSKKDQDRVFILVRSANDADSDIALYNQRTHGFFPKATIHKERVKELLGPAWLRRFPTRSMIKDERDHPVPDVITTMSDETSSVDGSYLGNNDAVDNDMPSKKTRGKSQAKNSAPPKIKRTKSSGSLFDLDAKSTTGSLFDLDAKSTTGSLFDLDVKSTSGSLMKGSVHSDGSQFDLDDETLDEQSEKDEIWALVMKIDKMIKGDEETCAWDDLWSKLHALKGDLPALGDNKNIAMSVSLIEDLRGPAKPKKLQKAWTNIYDRVLKEVQ